MFFKRGLRRYKTTYSYKDLYKFYKENTPKNHVSYNTYIKVLRRYFDLIMPMIIEENLEIRLPAKLGDFRIRQLDYLIKLNDKGEIDKRHLTVNYKKSKELWAKKYPDKSTDELKEIKDKPLVYYLNEHSDGKLYQFFWDKILCKIPHQRYYKISIIRKWKNYLSNYSRYESPIYFK